VLPLYRLLGGLDAQDIVGVDEQGIVELVVTFPDGLDVHAVVPSVF